MDRDSICVNSLRILRTSAIWVIVTACQYRIAYSEGEFRYYIERMVPKAYSIKEDPNYRMKGTNSTEKTSIFLNFEPQSVFSVDPKNMDFTVLLQITISWIDNRCKLDDYITRNNFTAQWDGIPYETVARLWRPTINFENCKDCDHALTDPMLPFQLHLKTTMISTTYRSAYLFTCAVNLAYYPFDTQRCKIVIGNREDRTRVYLNPHGFNEAINHSRVRTPPEYQLTAIKTFNCTNSNPIPFDCIEYVFHLRRQHTHHVMQVFIPSAFIVVLSWISFWLDPDVASPRVALGLTSLLTLATQFNNAQKELPPVPTIKALDIWMFACIIMVFASLVEFAISNFYFRKRKITRVAVKPLLVQSLGSRAAPPKLPRPKNKEEFTHIDYFARIIFPIAFIVFNLIFLICISLEETS